MSKVADRSMIPADVLAFERAVEPPCKHSSPQPCPNCLYHRLYTRRWYAKDPDHARAVARRNMRSSVLRDPDGHRTRRRARVASWTSEQKERARAAVKAWRASPEGAAWLAIHLVRPEIKTAMREQSRKQRLKNPERVREVNRAADRRRWGTDSWRAKNRAKAHRRIARIKSVHVENIDIFFLYNRDNGVCHLCDCGVPNDLQSTTAAPSIDHVIPISKGGLNSYDNVRLAHRLCNAMRSASDSMSSEQVARARQMFGHFGKSAESSAASKCSSDGGERRATNP